MSIEDRDWYWKDRRRRAKRYNPDNPAGDLPPIPKRSATKAGWKAFKNRAEAEPLPGENLVWNDKKADIELDEPHRSEPKPRPQPHQSKWSEPPHPKAKKTTHEKLTNQVQTYRTLLIASVVVNIMAFYSLWQLANP